MHGNSPWTAEAGSCPEPTSLDLGDCGSVEAATRLAALGSRNPARVRDAGVGAAACAQPLWSVPDAPARSRRCQPQGSARCRSQRVPGERGGRGGQGKGCWYPARSAPAARPPLPRRIFFLFFLFFSHFEADRLAVPRLGTSSPPPRGCRAGRRARSRWRGWKTLLTFCELNDLNEDKLTDGSVRGCAGGSRASAPL